MSDTFFRPIIMSREDANHLVKFHMVLSKLDLSDQETTSRVFDLYVYTEMLLDHIRQETDYDDYH